MVCSERSVTSSPPSLLQLVEKGVIEEWPDEI
jgi:hypothetical protein